MPKISYLLLGLLAFASSCQPSPETTQVALPPKLLLGGQGFAVADNLIKYQSADSLLLVNDSMHTILNIGRAGTAKYAIWLVDSTLIFYQQQPNQKWLACDTLTYPSDFSFAQSMDLNGDGSKDVRISTISGAAGNTENMVFLYDRKQARFRHNRYYDLPNVELDKQYQFIKSWWFAGIVHCQDKWKYRITGDSLTLDSGVSYCPNEKRQGEAGTLEFYKLIGDKKITTKRYTGDADKLMATFLAAFWDANAEY